MWSTKVGSFARAATLFDTPYLAHAVWSTNCNALARRPLKAAHSAIAMLSHTHTRTPTLVHSPSILRLLSSSLSRTTSTSTMPASACPLASHQLAYSRRYGAGGVESSRRRVARSKPPSRPD
eukprot:743493-Pelagomonas_calceolata.AAC.1